MEKEGSPLLLRVEEDLVRVRYHTARESSLWMRGPAIFFWLLSRTVQAEDHSG